VASILPNGAGLVAAITVPVGAIEASGEDEDFADDSKVFAAEDEDEDEDEDLDDDTPE
jgi:hypothetical protein